MHRILGIYTGSLLLVCLAIFITSDLVIIDGRKQQQQQQQCGQAPLNTYSRSDFDANLWPPSIGIVSTDIPNLNIPEQQKLGAGSFRISSGTEAPPGFWPWYARVYYDGLKRCSGALVHDNFVISALHCFFNYWDQSGGVYEPSRMNITLGRHLDTGKNTFLGAVEMCYDPEVSKWLHEFGDYLKEHNVDSLFKVYADIAVIRLAKPVSQTSLPYKDFDPSVLCLPEEEHRQGAGFGDKNEFGVCFHQGVGNIYFKWLGPDRKIVIDSVRIREMITGANCSKEADEETPTGSLCWAKWKNNVTSSCPADSGSPVACYSTKRHQWVYGGPVSWNVMCGPNNTTSLQTRATASAYTYTADILEYLQTVKNCIATTESQWVDL